MANIANPPAQYVDGLVQFSSFAADILRGARPGSVIASAAIFENFTFTTPVNNIRRPNQIGGPNGFVLVNTQQSASGTIQIADVSTMTETPKNGDWFVYIRDLKNGAVAETWVLHDIGDVFEMNGYRKINCQASQAHNPP
jgi:hypothetical protein